MSPLLENYFNRRIFSLRSSSGKFERIMNEREEDGNALEPEHILLFGVVVRNLRRAAGHVEGRLSVVVTVGGSSARLLILVRGHGRSQQDDPQLIPGPAVFNREKRQCDNDNGSGFDWYPDRWSQIFSSRGFDTAFFATVHIRHSEIGHTPVWSQK